MSVIIYTYIFRVINEKIVQTTHEGLFYSLPFSAWLARREAIRKSKRFLYLKKEESIFFVGNA